MGVLAKGDQVGEVLKVQGVGVEPTQIGEISRKIPSFSVFGFGLIYFSFEGGVWLLIC
jgi:hypothetical protein